MDISQRFVESVKWSILLHGIYFALLFFAVMYESFFTMAIISIIGLLFSLYYLFFRSYKQEELFLGSWVMLITVLHIGVTLGRVLEPATVISIGVTVSVMDIISFTKKGKSTPNARAMANTNFASKLILYAISPKDKHLIPAKGLGDFLFYSIWIAHCHLLAEGDWSYLLAGMIAIFIGTVVDWYIISKLYLRENYKGFPATPIPFVCILSVIIIAMIKS